MKSLIDTIDPLAYAAFISDRHPGSHGPFVSESLARAKGLKQFYTGKPCRKGHFAARSLSDKRCHQCVHPADRNTTIEETTIAKLAVAMRKMNHTCQEIGDALGVTKQRAHQILQFANALHLNRVISRARPKPVKQPRQLKDPEVKKQEARERTRRWKRANPERARLSNLQYLKDHPEKVREYRRRWRSQPENKLICSLRRRFHRLVVSNNPNSSHEYSDFLGCTPAECRAHIESLFLPGMSWFNHGVHGWHIDHIRPCASFDDLANSEEQQRECFHYTNLQPLWAADNIAKSDTWEAA